MPDFSIAEAEEQARKAARYFGKVLGVQTGDFIAVRVEGVTLVVAVHSAGETLERLITEGGIFGKGKRVNRAPEVAPTVMAAATAVAAQHGLSVPLHEHTATDMSRSSHAQGLLPHEHAATAGPVVNVLIPRYHAPPADRGEEYGHVHLHVLNAGKFGRRERASGECLCGKKHGSDERPVSDAPDPPTVCAECRRVAADAGLSWSLT